MAYRRESWVRTHITQRSTGPWTCSLVGANGSQYGVNAIAIGLAAYTLVLDPKTATVLL